VKKTTILLITTLFAILTASVAHAQVKYVAVVETEIDAQSGAAAKLNKAEARQITAALRREAVNNLPRGKYNIMTSETVQAQGGAVLEECAEENCVITLGSKIGADYIVRGIISKIGANLTVTVEMYETNDGTLVASSDLAKAGNASELLEKATAACAKMFKVFVNPQYSTQSAQQVLPPQQPQVYQQSSTQTPVPTYQQSSGNISGTFTDKRDGKTYKTVVIGKKRWMAENLNYQPQSGNSWCYNNDNSNCGKYGRLYDWNTAKTICSPGWHLPSRQEWNDLVTMVGGDKAAGKKLKAESGWDYKRKNDNGTNDYGFSALPSGARKTDGSFHNVGYYGYWWTATESGSGSAYIQYVHYVDNIKEYNDGKSYGFSVRCVQD